MSRPEVILATGHMVDLPDRPTPRFPASEVPRVATAIDRAMSAWGVGAHTTLVCGGARGADLLAAESALRRGATVVVSLPLPVDRFVDESVAVPDDDQSWVERFHAVMARAEVLPPVDPGADGPFRRNNDRMIEDASARASGAAYLLAVWNGASGDGDGGTADMVRAFRPDPGRVRIIDPTPRRYQARQDGPGPKKLLALDGGGTRAMLTLGILHELEARLREATGDDGLVLADEFDLIGGTSSGAFVAAGLALGRGVDEVAEQYRRLAARVFSVRALPRRLRSVFRDRALTPRLRRILGDRMLGDPELRSLLLVVVQDDAADTPWMLGNCTEARYNRADRYLRSPSDRLLDLDLVRLLRGSLAAPAYFGPDEIRVGSRTVSFRDGGITPFVNPALLMLAMATLPEYGLGFPAGSEELLLVSIGTGRPGVAPVADTDDGESSASPDPPRIVMGGAAVGQDLLCRALGDTRHGPVLDSEVGDRVGAPAIGDTPLFTYLRYDADLGDRALVARGLSDAKLRRAVRSLQGVEALDALWDIGTDVGRTVGAAHVAGFLRADRGSRPG